MPSPRRIRVNDRDIRTLEMLGEYGVLDRELIHRLCFAEYTAEWCRQNVSRLVGAGLVRSTTLQVWHDEQSRGGRIPQLFSLTKAGAETVTVRTGNHPLRVLKSDPSAATYWHRLGVVRVRIAFDRSAADAGLPPLRFIMEQDTRPGVPAKSMPHHRRMLYHEYRSDGGVPVYCRPDAAALIRIPHPSGDEAMATNLAVHLEIDRSREGVAQCLKKLPGYAALTQQRGFTRYWGDLPNLIHRVFWVVPSRERIASLCAAFRSEPVAADFRFITDADCTPESVLTQPVWRDLSGAPMTLYRRSAATT